MAKCVCCKEKEGTVKVFWGWVCSECAKFFDKKLPENNRTYEQNMKIINDFHKPK